MPFKCVLATVNQDIPKRVETWPEGSYHTFYYTNELDVDPHRIASLISGIHVGNVVTAGEPRATGTGLLVSSVRGHIVDELSTIVGEDAIDPVYATVEPVAFKAGTCFRIGAISLLEVVNGCMLRHVRTVRLRRTPGEDQQAAEAMIEVH